MVLHQTSAYVSAKIGPYPSQIWPIFFFYHLSGTKFDHRNTIEFVHIDIKNQWYMTLYAFME